eukprot:tig00021070_g17885.t1
MSNTREQQVCTDDESQLHARLAALRAHSESEPLEYVNAVQDFAALVAVDSEYRIAHASANCASFFGLPGDFGSVVGRSLDAILDPEALLELREASETPFRDCRVARPKSNAEGDKAASVIAKAVEMSPVVKVRSGKP